MLLKARLYILIFAGSASLLLSACLQDAKLKLSAPDEQALTSKEDPPPYGMTMSSPNSGTSSNDSTPTISGSGAISGNTFYFYKDNLCTPIVGSSIVNGGGIFSATLAYTPITDDGSRTTYFRIWDGLQFTSDCASTKLTYTLDSIPPNAPTGVALLTPASSPGATLNPTLTVSGIDIANTATISIHTDISCSSSAVGSVNGSFSASASVPVTTALTDGSSYALYAKATDAAGNYNCSSTFASYTPDVTPPTVSMNASPAVIGVTYSAYSISGSCSEITRNVVVTSGAASSTIACGGGNVWSTTIDLTSVPDNPAITFNITHTDLAGNSTTVNTTRVKDTVPPGITITSSPSVINGSNVSTLSYAGTCETAEEGNTVTMKADTFTIGTGTCTSMSWTVNPANASSGSIPQGNVSITALITDDAGNLNASSAITTMKDTVVPVLAITSAPAWIYNGNNTAYNVIGTCTDATSGISASISVSVSDGTNSKSVTTACSGGSFNTTIDTSASSPGTLGDGNSNITVTASTTDVAGNYGDTATLRSHDITYPSISVSAPTYIYTMNQGSYNITGSCSDATSGVSGSLGVLVTDLTNSKSVFATCSAGSYSVSVNTLSSSPGTLNEGTNNITVSVSINDAAGNSNSASVLRSRDVTPPAIPSISINSGDDAVNVSNITLTLGTAGADQMYVTNDAGCGTGGVWESPVGTKPWTIPDSINIYKYIFVKTKDVAGNVTPCADDYIHYEEITSAPSYTNYKNWMKYIFRPTITDEPFSITSPTACAGGGNPYCVHGGELRRVPALGYTTCTNLTMDDTLNAFDWVCRVETGPQAVMYSVGLKEGKGLRDLISASDWNSIGVTLRVSGTPVKTSIPRRWWSNTVTPLYASSGAYQAIGAGDNGKIFTVSTPQNSLGYNLTGTSEIAIVTLGSGMLTFTGGINTGPQGQANGANFRTLLAAGSGTQSLWIEANLSGGAISDQVVYFFSSSALRIHRTNITNSFGVGLKINLVDRALISDSTISNNASHGMHITDTYDLTMNRNRIYSNNGEGITTDTLGTVFQHRLRLSSSFLASNQNAGLWHFYGNDNIMTANSTVNNTLEGLGVHYSDGTTLQSNLILNNGSYGLGFNSSKRHTIDHAVIQYNGSNGIYYNHTVSTGIYGKVMDVIKINGNGGASCSFSGPGVTAAEAGFDNSCNPAGNSSFTIQTPGAPVSLNGKVTSNDTINTSDAAGQATFATLISTMSDWFSFQNPFRMWGQYDATGFPTAPHRGTCASGDNCQIFDYALQTADSIIRNLSVDGMTSNTAPTNGTSCPGFLTGNSTNSIVSQNVAASTYLKNAIEIIGDYFGNENGLCESNERCIYTPNFGAYQGHGDYTQYQCLFNSGASVTNVTMHYYPTNGF